MTKTTKRRTMGRLRPLTLPDRRKRQARRDRNGTLTGAVKIAAKTYGPHHVAPASSPRPRRRLTPGWFGARQKIMGYRP